MNAKFIIFIIQFISISRALAGLIFVTVALNNKYQLFASILYIYACLSDVVDGYLARKFNCSSKGGEILDLFGDKYLTIASLFFAAFKGIHPLPICVIAFREIFLLTIRTLIHKNKFIIPTNRLFGGVYTFILWLSTYILLMFSDDNPLIKEILPLVYWGICIVAVLNLIYRIKKNWITITQQFIQNSNKKK